jgi:hypothetical protein
MIKFSENLQELENTDHIIRLELYDADGNLTGTIENKPGSQGSVKVYHHLYTKYGCINPEAAEDGLDIYAEHTDDAASSPNKHPNIDRLFEILEHSQTITVKVY